MSSYKCLAALVPAKKQPAIRVKIVRAWKSPIGSIRPNTYLIIGDENVSFIFHCFSFLFNPKFSDMLHVKFQ